ncbi:hypothetical protein HYU93_00495 [Candidatus Daviesbacteria bacterium]|nr:hypothetical protein [Candidatus Daviesbacteria bacterium]
MSIQPPPYPHPELPPPFPLPIISEDTKRRLLEETGLDTDPRTRRIIQGISGEPTNVLITINSLTDNVFLDLIDINRGLVEAISEELTRLGPPTEASERTKGMALVLRAFHIQSGFDLLPRLGNLKENEDKNMVRGVIRASLPSKTQNLSLLEGLLTMPRIPEQQIVLNELIKKAGEVIGFKKAVSEGASVMYQILGRMWPRLYPPQTLPPQLPPDL